MGGDALGGAGCHCAVATNAVLNADWLMTAFSSALRVRPALAACLLHVHH